MNNAHVENSRTSRTAFEGDGAEDGKLGFLSDSPGVKNTHGLLDHGCSHGCSVSYVPKVVLVPTPYCPWCYSQPFVSMTLALPVAAGASVVWACPLS